MVHEELSLPGHLLQGTAQDSSSFVSINGRGVLSTHMINRQASSLLHGLPNSLVIQFEVYEVWWLVRGSDSFLIPPHQTW